MSGYIKKTDRPRAYPVNRITSAVGLACATNIRHASRQTGLSTFTIRRHLLAAGFTPKPVGCQSALTA